MDRVQKFHPGIDLVKPLKSPIPAFTSGTVTWAKWGNTGTGYGGYGNVVAIRDSNGYTHVYAHLDSIAVKERQLIKRGEIVGTQGATGRTTGPHLHYEIRSEGWGSHVDPGQYLTKYFRGLRNLEDRGNPIPKSKEGVPMPKCKVYLDGKLMGEGFIFEDRTLYYITELEGKKFEIDRWDHATKSIYLRSV